MNHRVPFCLVLVLLAGCKGEQKSASCVEGASAECACPGGGKGAQVCTAAGTFGPCDCGSPAEGGATAEVAEAAGTPKVAGNETGPGPADHFLVTSTSFGPLRGDTIVNVASLQKLFPRHTVREATQADEGEEWTVFQILGAGSDEPVLIVTPADEASGKLGAVQGRTPAVQLESGVGIGSSYQEVVAALGTMSCGGGIHGDADLVLCTPKKHKKLTVAFDMGNSDLAFKELGAKEQKKLLEGKSMSEISWRP